MSTEPLTNGFPIDLHVHTAFGSACAELHQPETLPGTMERRRLNGVVITEHNLLWPRDKIRAINRQLTGNRRIYSGIEVSTSRFHVVVIGLTRSDGIYPGMPAERLIEQVENDLAVAILVHPYLTSTGFDPAKEKLSGFHGMEVASTMTRGEIRTKTLVLCKDRKTVPVAGSDAHCSENLGKAFTCFPSLPADEKELAFMIRKGLGVPMTRETNGETLIVC